MTEEIINFKPVTFGKMLCNLSGKSNGSILKWDIMSRWIDGIVCKYTRTMYRAKLSWRTQIHQLYSHQYVPINPKPKNLPSENNRNFL